MNKNVGWTFETEFWIEWPDSTFKLIKKDSNTPRWVSETHWHVRKEKEYGSPVRCVKWEWSVVCLSPSPPNYSICTLTLVVEKTGSNVRSEERFWRTSRPVKFSHFWIILNKKYAGLELVNLSRVFPPPCVDYSSTLLFKLFSQRKSAQLLPLSYLTLTLLGTFCLQIRRSLTDVGGKIRGMGDDGWWRQP